MDDKIKARIYDLVRHSANIPESYTEDQCKDLEAEMFHMVMLCLREEFGDMINCRPNETGDRVLNRLSSVANNITP